MPAKLLSTHDIRGRWRLFHANMMPEVRLRIRPLHALAAGTLAIALSTLAQQQPQPQQPIRRPDGGTSGSMESIFIAPKAGAVKTCLPESGSSTVDEEN
jgi:hypothetical protein